MGEAAGSFESPLPFTVGLGNFGNPDAAADATGRRYLAWTGPSGVASGQNVVNLVRVAGSDTPDSAFGGGIVMVSTGSAFPIDVRVSVSPNGDYVGLAWREGLSTLRLAIFDADGVQMHLATPSTQTWSAAHDVVVLDDGTAVIGYNLGGEMDVDRTIRYEVYSPTGALLAQRDDPGLARTGDFSATLWPSVGLVAFSYALPGANPLATATQTRLQLYNPATNLLSSVTTVLSNVREVALASKPDDDHLLAAGRDPSTGSIEVFSLDATLAVTDNSTLGAGFFPSLATDSSGNIVVAYFRSSAIRAMALGSSLVPLPESAPAELNLGATASGTWAPAVTVGPDGGVTAYWTYHVSSSNNGVRQSQRQLLYDCVFPVDPPAPPFAQILQDDPGDPGPDHRTNDPTFTVEFTIPTPIGFEADPTLLNWSVWRATEDGPMQVEALTYSDGGSPLGGTTFQLQYTVTESGVYSVRAYTSDGMGNDSEVFDTRDENDTVTIILETPVVVVNGLEPDEGGTVLVTTDDMTDLRFGFPFADQCFWRELPDGEFGPGFRILVDCGDMASYEIYCIDEFGDQSETITVVLEDTLDATPPSAPSNLQVEQLGTSFTLTWNPSTDSCDTATVGYDVALEIDTEPPALISASVADPSFTLSDPPNGFGVVRVTAVDDSGNESSPAELDVLLDTTGPQIRINAIPVAPVTGVGLPIYDATELEAVLKDELSSVVDVSLYVDDVAFEDFELEFPAQGEARARFRIEEPGIHFVEVLGTDSAGLSAFYEASFDVMTGCPVPQIAMPGPTTTTAAPMALGVRDVAITDAGQWVAVWQGSFGSGGDVGARFSPRATVLVGTGANPVVAMNAELVVVAWWDASVPTTRFRRYAPGGSPQGGAQDAGFNSSAPSIAMNGQGVFAISGNVGRFVAFDASGSPNSESTDYGSFHLALDEGDLLAGITRDFVSAGSFDAVVTWYDVSQQPATLIGSQIVATALPSGGFQPDAVAPYGGGTLFSFDSDRPNVVAFDTNNQLQHAGLGVGDELLSPFYDGGLAGVTSRGNMVVSLQDGGDSIQNLDATGALVLDQIPHRLDALSVGDGLFGIGAQERIVRTFTMMDVPVPPPAAGLSASVDQATVTVSWFGVPDTRVSPYTSPQGFLVEVVGASGTDRQRIPVDRFFPFDAAYQTQFDAVCDDEIVTVRVSQVAGCLLSDPVETSVAVSIPMPAPILAAGGDIASINEPHFIQAAVRVDSADLASIDSVRVYQNEVGDDLDAIDTGDVVLVATLPASSFTVVDGFAVATFTYSHETLRAGLEYRLWATAVNVCEEEGAATASDPFRNRIYPAIWKSNEQCGGTATVSTYPGGLGDDLNPEGTVCTVYLLAGTPFPQPDSPARVLVDDQANFSAEDGLIDGVEYRPWIRCEYPERVLPTDLVVTAIDTSGLQFTFDSDASGGGGTATIVGGPDDQIISLDDECRAELADYTSQLELEGELACLPSVTQAPEPGTIEGVQNLDVTLAAGTESYTFNASFVDDSPPVFIGCPDDGIWEAVTDPGLCAGQANFAGAISADDNCLADITATELPQPLPDGRFPVLGPDDPPLTVSGYVSDDYNVVTCSFDIVVKDVEPPAIECPNDIDVVSAPDQCGTSVEFDVETLDNCQDELGVTVDCTAESGDLFAVGDTPVMCTVTDIGGNTASCAFNVSVGATEPSLSCPDGVEQANDPGQCDAVVTYELEATDPCGIESVVASPPPGDTFPVGTTPVSVTATNVNGDSSSCGFDVTVVDAELPVLSCPGDITIQTTEAGGAPVEWVEPTASDNCADTLSPVRVTALGNGDTFPVGTTTVAYEADDGYGNSASCSFDVTVVHFALEDCAADQSVLWAPDHTMRDVTVSWSTTGLFGTASTVLAITSSQPDDDRSDGSTMGDVDNVPADDPSAPTFTVRIDADGSPHVVQLRAERQGNVDVPRYYTIVVEATDGETGNTATCTAGIVEVPHDQSSPE